MCVNNFTDENEIMFHLNCSVHKSNIVCENWERNISRFLLSENYLLQPVHNYESCLFMGILLAVLLRFVLKFGSTKKYTSFKNLINSKIVLRTITLIILIITSPLTLIFILIAYLYKLACLVIIKRNDSKFIEFLESFDVFWSLEEDGAKSVISVMGVIESESSYILIDRIKDKLRKIVPNKSNRKIFYRRTQKFGFYYWRKYDKVDLDEYVRIISIGNAHDEINATHLEEVMTDVSNHALPFNDEGLFQILITEQRIANYTSKRGDYGIIFRIHHSVGDGVALIEFLCRTLADEGESDPVKVFFMPESNNVNKSRAPNDLFDTIKNLCEIPICFVDGILRKPDENALHGPSLDGKKFFKRSISDQNLFHIVQEIKEHNKEMNFSDVLAAAMSSALQNFFSKTTEQIPKNVAVILPVRFPKSELKNEIELENNFTVTIMDLPITKDIKEISKQCNRVRKSCDPLVNYYFLKICGLLPKQILQPLFNSSQATLVFSNMPGPEALTICGGNTVKSLVFFIPHKGNTGLGITALCYGGVLRFAAMADANLVPTSAHLSLILDTMVNEIKQLHAQYVMK